MEFMNLKTVQKYFFITSLVLTFISNYNNRRMITPPINYKLCRTSVSKKKLNFKKSQPNFKSTSTLFHKATQQTFRSQQKVQDIDTTNLHAFLQKNNVNLKEHQVTCLGFINPPTISNKITFSELNNIEFPVLSYTVPQLIILSKLIIDSNPERRIIGKAFNLNRLIETISENYRALAYHNFSHAFSTLLLLHQTYNRSVILRKSLNEKQWFYVFIAALAHDINHPGTSNAFEVKNNSGLAMKAGNESVLQKMHVVHFWSILRHNSQINFLQGYSFSEAMEIRKLITRLILATDVSKHSKSIQFLKKVSQNKKPLEGQRSLLVMQQLFHGCDIGNPCLDFQNYMSWSALVIYEFNEITKREEQLGLPVTNFLKYEGLDKFYDGQIGFINAMVLPLWLQINCVLPGLEEMKDNILKNIKKLQDKKKDK